MQKKIIKYFVFVIIITSFSCGNNEMNNKLVRFNSLECKLFIDSLSFEYRQVIVQIKYGDSVKGRLFEFDTIRGIREVKLFSTDTINCDSISISTYINYTKDNFYICKYSTDGFIKFNLNKDTNYFLFEQRE